ncbi:hypothetical protein F751_1905 [Auxenochlorella protothecoides]|uniref:Uncharacterized protein n=1 Tax=Auxenochlorella protothecoides TaxID=3075 RepID=A0A087SH22_AUXPR|nr:hypothetical protein F751_1905 [Auxenochlorella protothecoides]KFM25026.1 hypothetical protein F751_1905 [Auxenochlorella protothecoides]
MDSATQRPRCNLTTEWAGAGRRNFTAHRAHYRPLDSGSHGIGLAQPRAVSHWGPDRPRSWEASWQLTPPSDQGFWPASCGTRPPQHGLQRTGWNSTQQGSLQPVQVIAQCCAG